ncbi:MAG: methylmalonyl-CoA epimerase [Sphingobacteriaceae bacterium]|nr:methylmalonyl-CoA epimerase [Sphingobacteriaceae bacterium]
MDKIEHIGIAVNSLKVSSEVYQKILGVKSYKQEEVRPEGVIAEFFKVGEGKIELLEPTNSESPIAKFLAKKGEGIHHIAFAVNNIYDEMRRLKSEGFILLSDIPKQGADNKLVCFVHPKDTSGVLIEICQEI